MCSPGMASFRFVTYTGRRGTRTTSHQNGQGEISMPLVFELPEADNVSGELLKSQKIIILRVEGGMG